MEQGNKMKLGLHYLTSKFTQPSPIIRISCNEKDYKYFIWHSRDTYNFFHFPPAPIIHTLSQSVREMTENQQEAEDVQRTITCTPHNLVYPA